MDRRAFLAGLGGGALGLAFAPAPGAAAGPSPALAFEAYARRLQASLDQTGGGRFVRSSEDDLYDAHQRIRAQHGLAPLAPHRGLAQAARAHAGDQTMRGYFGHAAPEGYASAERVGYLARTFIGLPGENIADATGRWLGAEPERLMEGWMNSPGHRANILHPEFSHLGLGVVQSGRRTVAVAVFGQRFAELPRPVPFTPSDDELADALEAAEPAIYSYDLSPVGRPERMEDFSRRRAPREVAAGVYTLRPRLQEGRRYTIVFGPIVELNGR